MTSWDVTLRGKPMDMGVFGRVPTAYGLVIEAPTEEEAIERARERARGEGAMREYADGKADVRRRRDYAVTVRGKKDKRRRETFYANASSPEDALRFLKWKRPFVEFAGSVVNTGDPKIIKIEAVDG
jgi:hypothetical protein